MPDSAHSTLTGAELHEPKGAAGATANQIYISDGAGSGTWTTVNNTNKEIITYTIDDISTAASHWVVPGIAGDISKITTVLHGALGTADAALTFGIGGTAITGSAITVTQSGSAAGDVDTSSPTAANTVTVAQPVEIITDGASSNTVKCTVTLEIDVS